VEIHIHKTLIVGTKGLGYCVQSGTIGLQVNIVSVTISDSFEEEIQVFLLKATMEMEFLEMKATTARCWFQEGLASESTVFQGLEHGGSKHQI
jgi:hypothetical protein